MTELERYRPKSQNLAAVLGVCFDKDLTGFENLLGLDTSRARRAIISMFAV